MSAAVGPNVRKAAEKIRHWRNDPVAFVRECLRAEPDEWQCRVLEAFKTEPRIALKACKGPGKTAFESWIGWLYLLTRQHAKGVAVSITRDNLRDGLWTEFAKWQTRSELLKSAFNWSAERIVARDHPETWWMSARSYAKDADVSAQADTLAGLHGEHCIVLLDEISEMPDGVVVAAEGAQSVVGQEVRIVGAGNPTKASGPLYRICTKDRARWWVYEITGDPDRSDRATRIDLKWAKEQIGKWGRDSSYVRTNVLGQFPLTESDKLLGPDDCAEATRRNPRDYDLFPKVLGVDVARFGADRSVIFPRQGRAAFKPTTYRELSATDLAGQVAAFATKWKPAAIFVDEGGVGGPVLDILRELKVQNLHGVDFGGKANQPERYLNRRAEMWWEMADWIKTGGAISDDPELVSELCAPSYFFTSKGQLQLESKEKIKARGNPSPDLADALALTFAVPIPVEAAHSELMFMANQETNHATTDYDVYESRDL